MPRGTVTGVWILSCLRRDSLWLSRNRFKVRRRWTTRSLLCEDFIESNCRRKWWWDPSWPISTIRRRNLPFRVTVWIWVLILSSSTVWSGWTSCFRSNKMICQLEGNNIRVTLKFILRIYTVYIFQKCLSNIKNIPWICTILHSPYEKAPLSHMVLISTKEWFLGVNIPDSWGIGQVSESLWKSVDGSVHLPPTSRLVDGCAVWSANQIHVQMLYMSCIFKLNAIHKLVHSA